jgi:phosphate transport system substrate-binding protein
MTITKKNLISFVLLGVLAVTAGCKPNQQSSSVFTTPVSLTGAGATFPAPLYQAMLYALNQKHPKLQISYQSVGSGAGVKQFTEGTVHFGASDVEMKQEERAKVKEPMLSVPLTGGSIVLAYNLPGIKEVKLSREVYSKVFLGEVTRWSDPLIAELNPGVTFPDLPITVVHRSDGSGTTAVFTAHLSKVSPKWQQLVGSGKSVSWPQKGTFVGSKGNEGVTAAILQTEGSIGYIEYGFATSKNLPMAILENKAGTFVAATPVSASKGLAAIELDADFNGSDADPASADAYPIVSYTRIMIRMCNDPANGLCLVGDKAKGIEAMVEYALNEGQEQAVALGYVALPEKVRTDVATAVDALTPDYSIVVK